MKPRKLTEEAKAKMIDIDDFIPEGNWDVVNTGANWSPGILVFLIEMHSVIH